MLMTRTALIILLATLASAQARLFEPSAPPSRESASARAKGNNKRSHPATHMNRERLACAAGAGNPATRGSDAARACAVLTATPAALAELH